MTQHMLERERVRNRRTFNFAEHIQESIQWEQTFGDHIDDWWMYFEAMAIGVCGAVHMAAVYAGHDYDGKACEIECAYLDTMNI